jgi:hypothetical protein
VADVNRERRDKAADDRLPMVQYSAGGHPSIEQLMAEQGTGPVTDPAVLHGNFWPEEETIEDFLAAFHDWRGHKPTEPAA